MRPSILRRLMLMRSSYSAAMEHCLPPRGHCSPSASSADRVAIGGPISSLIGDGIYCMPSALQSVTSRPVVVPYIVMVMITARLVNRVTTLFVDGQASSGMIAGDRTLVRFLRKD